MHDISQDLDPLKFKLGNTVRDKVTGFVGIASIVYVNLSHATQVYIDAKRTEVAAAERSVITDAFLCEFVDEGVAHLCPAPVVAKNVNFMLGDRVKDLLTGFKGYAVQRVYSMSGCIGYNVQAQGDRILGGVHNESLDQARLVATKKGKFSALFKGKEPFQAQRENGAPMIRNAPKPRVMA